MSKEFKTWTELKLEGSGHYKVGEAQNIDIYKQDCSFRPWALNEITQHARRNWPDKKEHFIKDMVKIIHYAELLIAEHLERQ